MVVASLFGGLGNQLFQYAAGKALSHALDVPFGIDVQQPAGRAAGGLHVTARTIEITRLCIAAEIVAPNYSKRGARQLLLARGLRLLGLGPLSRKIPGVRTYVETTLRFCPTFFRATSPIRIHGYFQSEKYFSSISTRLRKEFLPCSNNTMLQATRVAHSARSVGDLVGIHVRRGDYISPTFAAYHTTPSLDYLKRAISSFGSEASFLVVTDDIEWCRQNLPTQRVTIVSSDDPLVDLYAFAACDGFVLSASSFSWWGSWLGDPGGEKRTIAPARWFGPARDASEADDIFRVHWERI